MALRIHSNDGYVERVAWLVFWCWVIAGTFSLTLHVYEAFTGDVIGRDSTDAEHSHSGLGLYTDYSTGCQYLARPFSGVTPRLDRDGRPMCGGR